MGWNWKLWLIVNEKIDQQTPRGGPDVTVSKKALENNYYKYVLKSLGIGYNQIK